MYSIYSDGNLVYAPTLAKEGYAAISPKLTQELNKSGSLTFTLPPDNEMYDSISKLKSIITVMQDDDEIFRGRELNDEKDFYNRKKKYCEGELAFLLDSIQRPYEFTGDIPDLFKQFISNHNEQVDEEKQFTVGEITVTDPNNYINRSNSDYSTTWDAINDKLIATHGGYLRARMVDGIRYLDLVEDYGDKSSQTIEFGTNLLDITDYIDASDVFTVLIPLGVESEADEDGNTTRLTIEEVNDGLDYIESETGIELFGRIWRTNEWDDVTLAENLLTKGQEYLDANIEMAVSLTVSAVDMHLVDVDTERLKLGDYVRVVSKPHNLDAFFLCSKIVLDLENPENSEYTFGVNTTTLTNALVTASKEIENMPTETGIVNKALAKATDLINDAVASGYAIHEPNEFIIADDPDYKTAAKYLWRWGYGGLAHYSNGYYGDADGVAITMDGQITADFITAGSMTANVIKTGILQDTGSNVVFDLDSGTLTMKKGSIDIGDGAFSVTEKGAMTCTSAEITGKIYAASGSKIGGWTLSTNKIYATNEDEDDDYYGRVAAIQKPRSAITWVFAAGGTSHDSYSDCPFRVSKAGKLYAEGAVFTGTAYFTESGIAIANSTTNGGGIYFYLSDESTYKRFMCCTPVDDLMIGNTSYDTYLYGNTITANKSITVSSDARLKTDFGDMAIYDKAFDALQPLTYRWKTGGKQNIGFTYQQTVAALEAAGIDPEDCSLISKYMDNDSGEEYGGIAYTEMIGLLVYEVQNLKSQVKSLQVTA